MIVLEAFNVFDRKKKASNVIQIEFLECSKRMQNMLRSLF
jgi:hypothetical protein